MSHVMIDIETLAADADALILTIAAQPFDPFGKGHYENHFYRRLTIESQPEREINDGTIEWWTTQSEAQAEAFNPEDRVPLKQALDELRPLIWNATALWSQGYFDFMILDHAYKSFGEVPPWQFWKVKDSRSIISLYPDCPRPTTAHHALTDCQVQIDRVQQTLAHLGVKEIR